MNKNKYDIGRTTIKEYTRMKLWALSAGRCEICNTILYKDTNYGFDGNFSNIAHIIGVGKNGPRSSKELGEDKNSFENLMLLCPTCHHGIDNNTDYFTENYLLNLKKEHERRVEYLTGIDSKKECLLVSYFVNVNEVAKQYTSNKSMLLAVTDSKMLPKQHAIIDLCDDGEIKYSPDSESIIKKASELETQFNRSIKHNTNESLAIFAFACQPLLFKLGSLLSDQRDVMVFQPQRDSMADNRWSFSSEESNLDFKIIHSKTSNSSDIVALVLDLSAKIVDERIEDTLGNGISIYHLTVEKPNRDIAASLSTQKKFVEAFRQCIENIKNENEGINSIHIFPAMPISLAIKAGMDRMPKTDPAWIIYEQNNISDGFYKTLTIGE